MRALGFIAVIGLMIAPALAQDGEGRGVFGDGDAVAHHERPRPFDVEHYRIAVDVDPTRGTIVGDVSLRLRPLHPAFRELALDFGQFTIDSVTGDRGTVKYDHADGVLRCTLSTPIGVDDTLTLRVKYRGAPTAGLYFVRPDAGHPTKPVMVWSQGEPELAHHWFPCWDRPNDFATFEQLYTVPAGMTAVGNGTLVDTKKTSSKWTWHWKSDTAHVAYLVTLVAGKLTKITEQAGDVPLEHYLPTGWPDLEGASKRSFGKTAAMVAFMQEHFGVKYPYTKYAHCCVVDFLWGGMENASASTMTANTLHDARAHLDWKSDGLVIHELAHQWFGDLVTCRDWSQIWLNEGFASYCEALWTRHEKGDAHYRAQMRDDTGWYLWEDGSQYRRAMVTNVYADAQDMFDGHTYSKGSRVLYMLHELVGEDHWRAACKAYLERHRGQPVTTGDLQAVFEDVAGRELGWFFDQWCHKPGLPELTVSWRFDAGLQSVILEVQQTQDTSDGTPLFSLPCTVVVCHEDGSKPVKQEHAVVIQGLHSRFVFPATTAPSFVRFDKYDVICKQLTYERPVGQLLSQLLHSDDDVCARLDAIEALNSDDARKNPGWRTGIIAGLRDALEHDPHHAVRVAAAGALAHYTDTEEATLTNALTDKDSRVRVAAVNALASASGPIVPTRLRNLFDSDQSYRVQAAIISTLASLQATSAVPMAFKALRTDSHREVVRAAGLTALFTLKHPAALERTMNASRYGNPTRLVGAAINLLRDHAGTHADVVDHVAALCTDPFVWTRNTAIEALGKIGSVEHLGVLREREGAETDGRLRAAARKAMQAIESRDRPTETPQQAKARALEAKAREAELRAELQSLEAEIAARQAEKLRVEAALATAKAEAEKLAAGASHGK